MPTLHTTYFGPVSWYAAIANGGGAAISASEDYRKQTERNRCRIATANGVQLLTVPVTLPPSAQGGKCPIRQVRISDHGNWRHLHWQALQAAYGMSPFFDYYADDFQTLYRRPPAGLADFNHALLTLMLRLLDLECSLTRSSRYVTPHESMTDLRTVISPKASPGADPRFEPRPYYQVFAARTGFLPRLSMVDLLFHMGPESRLILRDSLRR